MPGKRGRPQKEISDQTKKAFLALIGEGDSDSSASDIVGVPRKTWDRLLKRDPAFAQEYAQACQCRSGELAILIRQTMRKMIAAGNVWFVKLALRNYRIGMLDPDMEAKKELLLLSQQKPATTTEETKTVEFGEILAPGATALAIPFSPALVEVQKQEVPPVKKSNIITA